LLPPTILLKATQEPQFLTLIGHTPQQIWPQHRSIHDKVSGNRSPLIKRRPHEPAIRRARAQRPEVEAVAQRLLLDAARHAVGEAHLEVRLREIDGCADVFAAEVVEWDYQP
jgi:hypothetical protein